VRRPSGSRAGAADPHGTGRPARGDGRAPARLGPIQHGVQQLPHVVEARVDQQVDRIGLVDQGNGNDATVAIGPQADVVIRFRQIDGRQAPGEVTDVHLRPNTGPPPGRTDHRDHPVKVMRAGEGSKR
jgi:hypothetical protein